MRRLVIGLCMLCCAATSTLAQVSIGIGLPGVSIGINLPVYPELVRVPGYPVYYAPRLNSNFFFYDGMYWVYEGDGWYASSWYNGPWGLVDPRYVPVYVLRIPVRYYRSPPPYFRGWRTDAPPRWGEHWGNDWARQRSGWDQWNRRSAPAPAPLPAYQRGYSGDRYPRQIEQQQALLSRNYRYQPRDPVVRQHYQEHKPAPSRTAPAPPRPPAQDPKKRPHPATESRARPPSDTPQRQPEARPAPPQAQQHAKPGAAPHPARAPRAQDHAREPPGKGPAKEPRPGPQQRGGPGQQAGGERGR